MSMIQLVEQLKAQRIAEQETTAIASEWWGTMALAVSATNEWVSDDSDKKELAKMLAANVEARFKDETGDKSMPSAYRSAKSVVCSAKEYGVSLLNHDGSPKGKTEVEKEIKEAKADKSTDDKIAALASTIARLLERGDHTVASVDVLREVYNKSC